MNTQQENFAKQANVALLAIFQHAVDHGLSSPLSIDLYRATQKVSIRLYSGHEDWIQSVVVLEEDNEKVGTGPSMRTAWTVQLPESGVVFDLVTYREQPLMAVPA